MAITQVTAPLSVPATNADWTNMTYHLKANRLGLNNHPFILTNSENTSIPAIAIGSYIQFGGNLYIVDTEDYAITGTPVDGNNYIRISGTTTLTAEWIQDISGYVWNPVYGYKYTGSYAILPYVIIKDGAKYDKYSTLPNNVFLNKINGFTLTPFVTDYAQNILSSFASPGTTPTGLTFDGTNLISCDNDNSLIYIHNGVSSTILSSFASPSTHPVGLAFDGTNLISCDNGTDLIYIHNGVSSTILSSFASPDISPIGLTFDGTNLISCDSYTKLIYIHNGVSSTILSSFASPETFPTGLTFDGTNLISCDIASGRIYIHNGVSSTILSSFASPSVGPHGLAFDGTNLISCDGTPDLIYTHKSELKLVE